MSQASSGTELGHPLRVLLISPFPGLDPATGDVTYTEGLLATPPDGVVYESHVEAMRNGRLRERGRRASIGARPERRRRLVETALVLREKVINVLRGRGAMLWEPFRFFEIDGSYDLVHVHGFSVRLTGHVPPLVISNGARLPDLYADGRGWSAGRTATLVRLDLALARVCGVAHVAAVSSSAARVVTFTEHLRRWYVERGGEPSGVVTVPPGVPRHRRSDRCAPARPRVGFLASSFAAKGGDVLLAAVPAIQRAHPDVEVLIAGSAVREDLEPLPSCVRWMGPLTRHQVETTFLPSLDVFAYPTRFDGASLVLQEALSFGLPSAVSSYGPIPEMVGYGRAGLISPVGDPEALAANVVSLLEPNRRSELADAATRHFTEVFEEQTCRAQLRSVYDAVVQQATEHR